jgi:putative mRNA 3-end processing factor
MRDYRALFDRAEIDVASSGAVILGGEVVCDGFRFGAPIRVQTHVHDDHMDDFESSKQFQEIYMSIPTRDLLVAEFNADLSYRTNIHGVHFNEAFAVPSGLVVLKSSGHMLGAAQVLLVTAEGLRIGYSGDFQWPLDDPIQTDVLVVDATYGSPHKVREYSQSEAAEQLIGLVSRSLRRGPVNLKGYRGTIQRALEALAGECNAPIIASPKITRYIDVFRQHGWIFDSVLSTKSPAGEEAIRSGRYVRVYSKGDYMPDRTGGTTIMLSAFMSQPNSPVSVWPDGNCTVALSDHADFYGTLEYIKATNAQLVVTDNTRNHGAELAREVRDRLGITAVASRSLVDNEWGR